MFGSYSEVQEPVQECAEQAQEIVDAYKDGYKYAVKGNDVIISIWIMSTPNFTPFNNATK